MKIKSVTSLGKQPVYDITMPTNHNFILENGAIAHNCAHSTSYAIVSYITAYLKHLYPLEWWCAELTVESQKEDKIRDYAAVLGDLIRQPSAFESEPLAWKISEDGKLVPPLVTIKGIGGQFAVDFAKFIKAESIESLGGVRKPPKVPRVKKEPAPKKTRSTKKTKDEMAEEMADKPPSKLFECNSYSAALNQLWKDK